MTESAPYAARPAPLRSLAVLYEKHERAFTLGAFVAGFVFDVLTLPRVDSLPAIAQQGCYLALITAILVHMLIEAPLPADAPLQQGAVVTYRRYRVVLVHFLFGSLLNLYTIYYFKSASLLVSFAFMAVLVLLLAANEMRRFKSRGLGFKFALLGLCMLSFAAHVVPIVTGTLGGNTFFLSMAIGAVPLLAVAAVVPLLRPTPAGRVAREVLTPLALVLLTLLAFYQLRLIPPVPLSIPFMGIYHSVDKTAAGYRLAHERPTWRFWENGDQRFRARPGDRVYVFFSVYSPASFAGRVQVRWLRKDPSRGWQGTDTVTVSVVGGRADGFRGFAYKANYTAGPWQVRVETTDGREIGRLYFEVRDAPEAPRAWVYEYQ